MGGAVGWGVEVGVGVRAGVLVGTGLRLTAGAVVGPMLGDGLLCAAAIKSLPGFPAEAAGRVPASTAPMPAIATTPTRNDTTRGQRRRSRRALGM